VERLFSPSGFGDLGEEEEEREEKEEEMGFEGDEVIVVQKKMMKWKV